MTDSGLDAARAVLRRKLGEAASIFDIRLVTGSGECEYAEVVASHFASDRVRIVGTSPVALTRAAYHYLRHPRPDPVRIQARVPLRHYLSVCTYGYSACWWDWSRWEEELDWMALHGINHPLLLAGQEAIAHRVFLELGLTEEELARYFSGPAYLCWHRLGNLNGFKGPLPRSWIDGQEKLQMKIIDRARQLGMHPIVPGFSGFVPPAMGALPEGPCLMSAEPWAGFEPTTYLDPRSRAFGEVGRLYLEEYRRAYGEAHHYLCELFAEQVPRLDPDTELDDLAAIGQATWQNLVDFDPGAIWVMQGWPFYFAREYWTSEHAAALLDGVPAGRLSVLDLATEELETWRHQPVMRAKGWMFNVVHNYGGNTHLHGDLQGFVGRGEVALSDASRGRLRGLGISPEGIDQNPVVYELLTGLAWTSLYGSAGILPAAGFQPAAGPCETIAVWLGNYVQARYANGLHCGASAPPQPGRLTGRFDSKPSEAANRAWQILGDTVYGPERQPHPRFSWRYRPGDQPLVASLDIGATRQALEALLGASDDLADSPNYRRDLVDVCKTWFGAIADRFLESALGGDDRTPFFDALDDLDRLLATMENYRLSTWLKSAKAWAVTKNEERLYELNARSLLTYWGGPFLFDYATREWAGLVADFHARRWEIWFEAVDRGEAPPDFASWERKWARSARPPKESEPGCPINNCRDLLAKYSHLEFAPDLAFNVVRLDPRSTTDGVIDIELPVPLHLTAVAGCPVFGQGIRAGYALEIASDNHSLTHIPPSYQSVTTCRGMRFSFSRRLVHRLRLSVEVAQGSPGQLFQVVLWTSL